MSLRERKNWKEKEKEEGGKMDRTGEKDV